jgi:hypothetical protein
MYIVKLWLYAELFCNQITLLFLGLLLLELTNTIVLIVELLAVVFAIKKICLRIMHCQHVKLCNACFVQQVFKYIWMSNNLDGSNSNRTCIKTTMNFSRAISPAFYDIPSKYWPN